jgi:hypothetical protein
MHEEYFRRRLLQELKRAEECSDPGERAIHLQACQHYRALLGCGNKGQSQQR